MAGTAHWHGRHWLHLIAGLLWLFFSQWGWILSPFNYKELSPFVRSRESLCLHLEVIDSAFWSFSQDLHLKNFLTVLPVQTFYLIAFRIFKTPIATIPTERRCHGLHSLRPQDAKWPMALSKKEQRGTHPIQTHAFAVLQVPRASDL